jgi:hypothetical protein
VTDTNLITKEGLAPARKPILQRLKQVMDAKIKIQSGPNAEAVETDDSGKITKMPPSLCIMEATSYILGWDQEPGHNVSDGPPCTSAVIAGLMVELNDEVSDRKRAAMKQVIPDIINTAPLVWAIDRKHGCVKDKSGKCLRDANNNYIYPEVLKTNDTDKDYIAAENKRDEIIDAFMEAQPKVKDNYGDMERPEKGDIPMSKWLVLIRELAAVAKFDAANHATEADLTTPAIDLDNTDGGN